MITWLNCRCHAIDWLCCHPGNY